MILEINHGDGKKFVDAINANDLTAVKAMLAQGCNPNAPFNGFQPLYHALNVGNLEIVKSLLKYGADLFYAINDKDKLNDSRELAPPLCYLIGNFDNHFVHECLKELDVTKIIDKNGNNLLHMVAIHGLRQSVIPCLIHLGLNPEYENCMGYTPIIYAKIYKRRNIVHMLQDGKAMTRYNDAQFNTAVHSAVKRSDQEMAIILKGMGADIDRPNVFIETPLFEAVRRNDVGMTKLLIDYGANVNASNYHGESLFSHAIVSNAFACASLLISRGAKVKLENTFEEFPVWNDPRQSLMEIASFLVNQKTA